MKRLGNFICTAAAVVLVILTIEQLINGMPLLGVPSPQDVAAVTVTHTAMTEKSKQFTDAESISLRASSPIICVIRCGTNRTNPARM